MLNSKNNSFFLLCFLFCLLANGQNDLEQKFIFSVKAGLNNSIVDGNDTLGFKSGYDGTEAYGGLLVQFDFSDKSSIEMGTLISWTDNVTFLEIPLVYKHNIYRKWSVFTGARLDFILNSQENLSVRGTDINNSIGWGIPIGVQFDISDKFFAEAVYNFGFTSLYSDNILDILFAWRDTFRLGIGYKF